MLAIGIVALALVVRLGFIVATPGLRPFADAADYDRVAVSLAAHGDYPPSEIAPGGGPSALRPPTYPYLLAGAYWVTSTTHSTARYTVGRVLSALVSTLGVGLLGIVAVLVWGPVAALASMGLAAVYPPLATIGDALLSEPLFLTLVLATTACVLLARRSARHIRWAALAGVLLGLAVLTRTNGLLLILALVPALWRSPRRSWHSLGPPATLLATTVAVLVPWCVRDALVFHRLVPIATQTGLTLAGTYNPVSYADRRDPARWLVPTMAPYRALQRAGPSEAEIDRAFLSQVIRFVRAHPGYVATAGFYNLGRLLDLQGPVFEHAASAESGISARVTDVDVYAFYALGILAAAAVLAGGLRTAPALVWLMPLLMAISLIFVLAYMRYRLPIDAFLILFAAGGVERLRRRRGLGLRRHASVGERAGEGGNPSA
jgi:hypothetical protein